MNRRKTSAIHRIVVAALIVLAWGLSLLPAAYRPGLGRHPDRAGPGQERRRPAGRHRHRNPEGDRPGAHHGDRGGRQLPAPQPPRSASTPCQAELNGFATVTTENVRLNVATQREINIEMNASTVCGDDQRRRRGAAGADHPVAFEHADGLAGIVEVAKAEEVVSA